MSVEHDVRAPVLPNGHIQPPNLGLLDLQIALVRAVRVRRVVDNNDDPAGGNDDGSWV